MNRFSAFWKNNAFLYVILFVLAGCNLPAQATSPNIQPSDISPTDSPSITTEYAYLPSALYFLSDESGTFQVWRLSAEGDSTVQVTYAEREIKEYAVSPLDGQLIYLVDNQLILHQPDGSERMLVDGGGMDESSDEYFYYEQISGLAWMPDAPIFAYGQNGVHLYDLSTGEDAHVLQNQVDMLDSGVFHPKALYYPYEWSPAGDQLLLSVGFAEGGRLAVLHIASNQIVNLGEGIVCCLASWDTASSSVFVASPVTGLFESGLWQYDSTTGEKNTLLDGIAADNTLNFAGWPLSLPDGRLQFFFTNTAAYPERELPLTLVSATLTDMTTLAPIRAEAWQIREALWFPDGKGVILVLPPFGVDEWTQYGPIVLVEMVEQTAPQPLATNGYQLQWGP